MTSPTSAFEWRDRGFEETLLLVPGWATDHRVFARLALEYNYLVPVTLSPRDFTDALLNALRRERLARVAVLGWSLGGYLALDFARAHPEKVTDVVAAGMKPSYEKDAVEAIKARLRRNKTAYLRRFYEACFAPAGPRAVDSLGSSPPARGSDGRRAERASHIIASSPPARASNTPPPAGGGRLGEGASSAGAHPSPVLPPSEGGRGRLLSPAAAGEEDARAWFERELRPDYLARMALDELLAGLDFLAASALEPRELAGMKIAFVHGTEDRIAPFAEMAALKERLPVATLIRMDGAGHAALLDPEFQRVWHDRRG